MQCPVVPSARPHNKSHSCEPYFSLELTANPSAFCKRSSKIHVAGTDFVIKARPFAPNFAIRPGQVPDAPLPDQHPGCRRPALTAHVVTLQQSLPGLEPLRLAKARHRRLARPHLGGCSSRERLMRADVVVPEPNCASASLRSARDSTVKWSSLPFSVPKKRSTRPFCHGQWRSVRWWRMPASHSAHRNRREVKSASLSVRMKRGLP